MTWDEEQRIQLQGSFDCPGALRGEVQHCRLFSVALMGEVHYCHLLGGPGKCRQSLAGKNYPFGLANSTLVRKEPRFIELH